MIGTGVLARLLTPGDFGVVTMVTTFSLLLLNFGLNGFTEAVIQREELNNALASNLFWISLGAGFLLMIGFAATGSLLARVYGDSRVALVTAGVSLSIFFSATSVLHLALLKRAMLFSVLSANDILARVVSVAVSILLGWLGWGYWALVAGVVALPLVWSIGAWYLCRWIPSPPRRIAGTGAMVRFAMNVYGRFTINYCARNMDNLLVGLRFDAQSLGFYKKAYDLFALSAGQLTAPLTNVAVSALSRLSHDSIEYRRYLLSALGVMAFVGMGISTGLVLVGKDSILLLLGRGWEPAARIFTFFGPGIGVMILYGTHGWIHLSIGRSDRWFKWGLVETAVTGILFIFGLRWGPVGIALAWTTSFWILFLPAFWYAGKPIHLGIAPVIAAVWKYLIASVLAGGGTAMITLQFPSLNAAHGPVGSLALIVTRASLFGALYLVAVILLHRGPAPVYLFAGLVRQMVQRRRPRRQPAATEPPLGTDLGGTLPNAKSHARALLDSVNQS
jgi:PST family polysaccharide transporter